MADGKIYKSIVLITKLVDTGDSSLKLDLPFTIYGQDIVMNGRSVSYNLTDMSLENKEVMAKVDYLSTDKAKVNAFAGKLGVKFNTFKANAKYKKHYSYKIKDVKRKYDAVSGTPIEYTGLDKDDPAPFCVWHNANNVLAPTIP